MAVDDRPVDDIHVIASHRTLHRLRRPVPGLRAHVQTPRFARYQVYAGQEADFIVLAQHSDDQAETVLLQLLRGAGVTGGAAMPLLRE